MSRHPYYSNFIMAAMLLLGACKVLARPDVQSVDVRQKRGTVKLELSEKTRYHYFHLNDPRRFVIDLENTHWPLSWHKRSVQLGHVKDMRAGYGAHHRLRLVFDLDNAGEVTIEPAKGPAKALTFHVTEQHKNGRSKQHDSRQASRDIKIVIDPGHGGKDPGAQGPYGYTEKNVVLKISKDLRQRINAKRGFEATLTRRHDRYVPLRQRLRIARRKKADLFLAIHADAYKDRDAHGASVYALSKRGATSEAARWLARHENQSELAGVDVSDKGRILKSVLLDLSQTATLGSSLRVGHSVLSQLKKVTDLHHDSVEQAAFVVLKAPDTPSLLVESGFISNPDEERRLRLPDYRDKLAKALTKGVERYFYRHPPQGTRVDALKKQTQTYTVKRGDNLSSIAQTFHTSTARLKQLNELSTSTLSVGQTLTVPAIVSDDE